MSNLTHRSNNTPERRNQYMIWLHEILARRFSEEELAQICNGFVLEIVNADEYPSFAAYRESVADWCVEDMVDSAGVRSVAWQNAGGAMSLRFDMPSQTMLKRQLDGENIHIPMFECPNAKQSRSGRIA